MASSIGVNAGSKVDGGGDWNRGSDSQAAYAAAAWLQGADLNESLSQFLNPMALFCLREFQGCRSAAERAISHNPMDGTILAGIGMMLAYSGDWVRRFAGPHSQLPAHQKLTVARMTALVLPKLGRIPGRAASPVPGDKTGIPSTTRWEDRSQQSCSFPDRGSLP